MREKNMQGFNRPPISQQVKEAASFYPGSERYNCKRDPIFSDWDSELEDDREELLADGLVQCTNCYNMIKTNEEFPFCSELCQNIWEESKK